MRNNLYFQQMDEKALKIILEQDGLRQNDKKLLYEELFHSVLYNKLFIG